MTSDGCPSDIVSRFNVAAAMLAELALSDEARNVPEAVRAVATHLGLKHAACLRFSLNTSEDVTLLSAIVTYSKDWQTRYFLRRYHLCDPVVAFARSALEPFDWREIERLSPESEPFFADARRHGVGAHGMTIPIRNRRNGLTLVSLTGDLPESQWTAFLRGHMGGLRLLAALIDYLASRSSRLPASPVTLSMREEQSLIWAARGKTVQEIADIMHVGYGSVRTYLDAARTKLKCVNVTHAVAHAIATGLIPAQALKGTDPREFSEATAA